jgi:histidinol-phosphate aminotransferase
VILSANENPLGPSPRGVAAAMEALRGINRYPDSTGCSLRAALAAKWGIPPECFLVENGLDGALSLIGRTFFAPGDEVVIPEPTFPVYASNALLMGARVIPVPLDGWGRVDPEGLIRAISSRTKAVFVPSPNNPTGSATRGDELRAILSAASGALVFVDEAYREFCDDPEIPDAVPWVERYPNLVAMRTFSKAYGLAGLRVGVVAARSETIRLLARTREPYAVNAAALAAAEAALADREHLERTLRVVREGRERLASLLRERRIPCPSSGANFLSPRLGGDAERVCGALAERGIQVRNLAAVGVPGSRPRWIGFWRSWRKS